MTDKEKLIELMKQVKFPAFPYGGLDVQVEHQLPQHGFEAIADHLITNGVKIQKEVHFYDVGTDEFYGRWIRCSVCGSEMNPIGSKFCCKCGAKVLEVI